jgi:hypothetical protein
MKDITELSLSVKKINKSFQYPATGAVRRGASAFAVDLSTEAVFYELAGSLINNDSNSVFLKQGKIQIEKCTRFDICITPNKEFLAHSPLLDEFSIGWLALEQHEGEYSLDSTLMMPIESKIYNFLDSTHISEMIIKLRIANGPVFMGFTDRLFASNESADVERLQVKSISVFNSSEIIQVK